MGRALRPRPIGLRGNGTDDSTTTKRRVTFLCEATRPAKVIDAGHLATLAKLLGHGHLSTTQRYLHLARPGSVAHDSPLDLLRRL